MTPEAAAVGRFRADTLTEGFDRVRADGSALLINDRTSDLLVHQGALREASRVLAAHAASHGLATLSYSLSEGVRALDAPGGPRAAVPSGVSNATPATVALDVLHDHCLAQPRPYLILVKWANHLLPAEQLASASGDTARIVEQLAAFATSRALHQGGHVIAFLSRLKSLTQPVTQLPGVAVLDLHLPGQAERRAAIDLMTVSKRHPLALARGFTPETVARSTGALTLHAISVMRDHTSPEFPLTPAVVRERAQAEFQRALHDIARVDTTRVEIGRDLVGLPQLRLLLEYYLRDPDVPLRLGFVGCPGTGKSFAARGLATFLGIPLILPETLKEQWVGASERNGVRFLSTLTSLAPAMTLLDDQSDSLSADRERGAHGDANGVSGSLTGLFLDRFGEPAGMPGVHLVIASNYARRIDPAMKSRIKCVPFLPPDSNDLAAQMEATARSNGWELEAGLALKALLEQPRRLTSRDAVTVLSEARLRSLRTPGSAILEEDLIATLTDYNPSIDRSIERQTLEALEATTFTSHLPWMAARHFGEADAQPPSYLREFVRNDGSLDRDRVTERINELEAPYGR